MKIFVASDHAGFLWKQKICQQLASAGHQVVDMGPKDDTSTDYPLSANAVCEALGSEKTTGDEPLNELGILLCGSGQGMCMRANKFPHIRASLCWNAEVARLARSHNNSNVLCLGQKTMNEDLLEEIVSTFLKTEFEGGRHARRVGMLSLPANCP